jgi:hypothetical protein
LKTSPLVGLRENAPAGAVVVLVICGHLYSQD